MALVSADTKLCDTIIEEPGYHLELATNPLKAFAWKKE